MAADKEQERGAHVIVMAALAAVRCRCGWHHRVEHLRGKSDEDLMSETIAAFDKHRKRKDAKT